MEVLLWQNANEISFAFKVCFVYWFQLNPDIYLSKNAVDQSGGGLVVDGAL